MRSMLMLATILGTLPIATGANAQTYPWCANFADGAGTNCGFQSLEQCKVTIGGSGGFCDQNTLYKPPVANAPGRQARKRHVRKNS